MTKAKAGSRWLLLLMALGVAWWIEASITLEWSYPYCSVLDSGPAGAVRGFPFPYEQSSIVTSATNFFIPWLYVINLAVITAVVGLLLRPLAARLARSNSRIPRYIAGSVAACLLFSAVALNVAALSMGVWRPTSSFSGSPPFSELRPVAMRVLKRQRDCTASPFWFPNRADRVPR